MNSGIYRIINLVNNHIYIGSSINLTKRIGSHVYLLKHNIHYNKHLQFACTKYGLENFEFRVLLCCDPENILLYEQMCINKFKPEYNTRKLAENNIGLFHTDETKLKISKSKKGKLFHPYAVSHY